MSDTTIHVTNGTVGVAWRLLCPSSSGGKVYTVAVVDKAVITAWGKASAAGEYGGGSQAQVRHYPNNNAALATAMEVTKVKEGRGYHLNIQPKQYTVTHADDTYLPPLDAVYGILKRGTPL